jgi:hypothetical protein
MLLLLHWWRWQAAIQTAHAWVVSIWRAPAALLLLLVAAVCWVLRHAVT